MAKKPDITNPFAKTSPGETERRASNEDLDQGRTISVGVGLKEGEVAVIDQFAGELGVTRNALMRWALRWFLLELRAGRIDLSRFVEAPPEPRKNLRLPG